MSELTIEFPIHLRQSNIYYSVENDFLNTKFLYVNLSF